MTKYEAVAERDKWGHIIPKPCEYCGKDIPVEASPTRNYSAREYAARTYCNMNCRAKGVNMKHRSELQAWVKGQGYHTTARQRESYTALCDYCHTNKVAEFGAKYCVACQL